ncbi:MAG: tannase/feruloyl esterase family alpha/beta hydrolase [Oceanospirillaceae bacterium]|nr:tannase/feruloyl esterase family alpha/beta hydrolase [Oceanospirillaceae bacterium]
MTSTFRRSPFTPRILTLAVASALLVACGSDDDSSSGASIHQLSAASAAAYSGDCSALAGSLAFDNTSITSIETIAAGTLTVGNTDIGEHCLVTGTMNERTSDVDGKDYAIGFEMRLPKDWNGRFFYQGNGGIDGNIVTAQGGSGREPGHGGGALSNALSMGFAVISSNAGHGSPNPAFGYDPQARLDYGYMATGTLTPMAKSVIEQVYGKGPDRSYYGGCSNGGRHAMVAATRYADEFDGFLVGAPGYRLPKSAVANIAGARAYASIDGTDKTDLETAFTKTERELVVAQVLEQCDALDGAADGMVLDYQACQTAFDIQEHVPTCSGDRDGSCLTQQQKDVIEDIYSGVETSTGEKIYTSFPFDHGLASDGVMGWEYNMPVSRDSGAVALIFNTAPVELVDFNVRNLDGAAFVFESDLDDMAAKTETTTDLYTESAMSFMAPPTPEDMSAVKNRGAKIIAYHGVSDAIFSVDDTAAWYDALSETTGDAEAFARFYPIPGMGHCRGGVSVDQFDMLTPLIAWVEQGEAPDSILASARGVDNIGGANDELPASWSDERTRPLCPYPQVARYKGEGDIEDASSFECKE